MSCCFGARGGFANSASSNVTLNCRIIRTPLYFALVGLIAVGLVGIAPTLFTSAMIPFWFLILATGSLAMICRLRWPPQFTLRSLFIATTFVAVVLGRIAWLDRAWIGK
jgi:hypothetical protein